jgi:hypothetical protein
MPNTPSYSQPENRFVRHDTLESDNAGADGLTAFPTGGQAGALPLAKGINRVTVVGTAGDSVLLPPASAGGSCHVINATATSLNVFPSLGDAINAIAANGAFALAGGKTITFLAAGAGFWGGNLTA